MRKAFRKAIMWTAVGCLGGAFWGALKQVVPAPVFWILWTAYTAGIAAAVLYMAWDLRRMNREQAAIMAVNARQLEVLQPHMEAAMRLLNKLNADREELMRQHQGIAPTLPARRSQVN